MACRIIIDSERCKGCGLCVWVCPQNCITLSSRSNTNGYFFAQSTNIDCNGCAMCAVICPDVVIEAIRSKDIVAIESKNKDKASLTREKA